MPRHVSCQDPASKSRTQRFLESPDQLLVLTCQSPISVDVDCSPHTFNILRCSACCGPPRMWITSNRFLTTFEAFVPHFYLPCTYCIIRKSLLNHPNSFCGAVFKLNAKCDADLLLYLLSYFLMRRPHSAQAHSTVSTAPTD